jgi:hypothetical protein
MGRTTRFLALLGLVIGVIGCQAFKVRTDWDPAISLVTLERYLWVEPPEVEGANPFADNSLLRKRVRSAIEEELGGNGFQAVKARSDADFLVTYSVILEERVRVDGYSAGGVYPYRFGGFGHIHSTASVRNYQESTLIIDFLDPSSDDLVWRGWASGIVRTRDHNQARARLAKGVEAILRAFPPEQGKAGAR